MVSEIVLAKQELLRFINVLDNIADQRIEPFSINIMSLLDRLREIIEKYKDTETVILDAETLYRISIVLGVQQKWVRERAGSLFIDSSIIFSKVISSSTVDLVQALLLAWRPIVRIEQITIPLLLRGYEHFISLPTKNRINDNYLQSIELQSEPLYIFEEEPVIENKLNIIRKELAEKYPNWINYWEFIDSESIDAKFERAYLLSFLISSGEVEVKVRPLDGKIFIRISKPEKMEERKFSLVINLGGRNE